MDKKEVELYLARTFSKTRKSLSGTGTVNTKMRIIDDVIFVKMKLEYSGLEKKLFRYISDKKEEASYYQSVREESTANAQQILNEICPLKIKANNFRIDIENGHYFMIIVLDDDLEKLIKDGNVTTPLQKAE